MMEKPAETQYRITNSCSDGDCAHCASTKGSPLILLTLAPFSSIQDLYETG